MSISGVQAIQRVYHQIEHDAPLLPNGKIGVTKEQVKELRQAKGRWYAKDEQVEMRQLLQSCEGATPKAQKSIDRLARRSTSRKRLGKATLAAVCVGWLAFQAWVAVGIGKAFAFIFSFGRPA